jgi:transcription elongation factor SPT6
MQDIPERMQLTNAMLAPSSGAPSLTPFPEEDLDAAAGWIMMRISDRHERDFFRPESEYRHLLPELVNAVKRAIRYMFIDRFEVPYVWTHKRDYISHFDPEDPGQRVDYLYRDELWRIYNLGRKYRSFLERRMGLKASFERLQVHDDYFTGTILEELDTVESVSDATEWLSLKYRNHRKDDIDLNFHDDDVESSQKRRKLPSKLSPYEIAKNSVIGKLALVSLRFFRP